MAVIAKKKLDLSFYIIVTSFLCLRTNLIINCKERVPPPRKSV